MFQYDQLSTFLKECLVVMEWYSEQLLIIGQSSIINDESTFDCLFNQVKQQVVDIGLYHQKSCQIIKESIYKLHQYKKQVKDPLNQKYEDLVHSHEQLKESIKQVEHLQQEYYEKCRISDIETMKKQWIDKSSTQQSSTNVDQSSINSSSIQLTLGLTCFNSTKFNVLMTTIHQLKNQEIKTMLTTYKNCIKGQDLLNHLKFNLNTTEGNAIILCNDLITNKFILPIKGTSFNISNYYQLVVDLNQQSKKEADEADERYKLQVDKCRDLRVAHEQAYYEFVTRHEECYYQQCHRMKQAIEEFQQLLRYDMTGSNDTLSMLLQSFQPDKQIQQRIEKDKTGFKHLPPIVYNNYYFGSQHLDTLQSFGISLDEMSEKWSNRKIPLFLSKLLLSIQQESDNQQQSGNIQSELDLWLEPISRNSKSIYNLKVELEHAKETTNLNRVLKRYPLVSRIGVLKLYLMELPDSCCSHEIYEPLKLLYLSKSEEFDISMRLNSLKSLLGTLSLPHYNALVALSSHWNRFINKTDERVNQFSQLMGPMILRPRIETLITIHDKHPSRFVKDLVLYPNEILICQYEDVSVSTRTFDEDDEDDDDDLMESRLDKSIELDEETSKFIDQEIERDMRKSSLENIQIPIVSSPLITRRPSSAGIEEDLTVITERH